MSYDIKMLLCGSPESIEGTELCIPIINVIFFDPTKIKTYIANQPKSVFFIVVLFHLFGLPIDSLVIEIGNKDQIIGIFVCVNQINNLLNNRTNIFHLSKRLLTCKATSCAIRSYELASQRLYLTDRPGLAYLLEQTSNNLKRWLTTSDKVRACDVLIIPLNTDDENLRHFQLQFIELCADLKPDFEPRVCTLYDFISSDGSFYNMSKEEQAFVIEHNKIICTLIEKLARIRIYLVGNDERISNNWSELMIKNEPDNTGQKVPQYDQWCTFVENEPVSIEHIHNLVHRYGNSWKVKNITPIRLDTIRDDIHFLPALDRSHTTIDAREMVANLELSLWAMNYHENSTDYSNEFHTIEEPANIRMEQNNSVTDEVNTQIQWYQRSLSNSDNNT